jgi:GT2 family glycosyltransferase
MKVFGVNAAACMVSRAYLEEQPFNYLFDEDFFMYLEDVDAIARAVILGWDSYFVPEARAFHMGSASSGKNPGFSVYMVNRNRIAMLIKNLPLPILLRLIPRMVVGDIQELYRISRAKNFLVMKKFIMGRIMGLFLVPRYLKKARTLSKARNVKSAYLWEFMRDGTQEF